jgi:hypothetical protein
MAKNSREQARSVVKPANILLTKPNSAATKVVRHGIGPEALEGHPSDVWASTNYQPPSQYDDNLFGYFLPFARPTSADLVPPTCPTPSQPTRPATGVSSIAPLGGTLSQVLYLQEPGDPAAISVCDINQGGIGDCFLLSSIGELALFDPNWITQIIHANADGTETVTLYRAANGSLPGYGATSYVTAPISVTNTFLSNGVNSYSSRGVFNGQQEIWVQVLEKAVATLCGGYSAIGSGGSPSIAMEELTGCSANYTWGSLLSLQQLQTAVTSGELIVFDTQPSGSVSYGLYNNHAYMFESLTTVNGTVMVNLLNPWGIDEPAPIPFTKVGGLFQAVEFDKFAGTGVNKGPRLVQQTPGQTWTQGSHVSLALGTGVFTEASGTTLTYAAAQANGQALPSWLSFNAATMTFSGTVPGGMQTLSLKVTATDTGGLSGSEIFQAAVPAAAPTLAHQTAAQTWTEGAPVAFILPSSTFADPNGEALSYTATLASGQALPSWLTLNSASGTFSGKVAATSGPMSIKVTATDTSGLSVSETFQATLVVPPPTVKDQTASQTWAAGQPLAFVLPSDTFTTYPGQTLKFAATLPVGLQIDPSTDTIRGTIPFAPGVYTIKVTATQTNGMSASETFKATLVAAAPHIADQTPGQTWITGRHVSFRLPSDTFADPQGEVLTYTVSGLPSGLSFNAKTLTISGTTYAGASTYALKVTATDQSNLSTSEAFKGTVLATAPSITDQTPAQIWTANQPIAFTLPSDCFADPQSEMLTYTVSGLPSGLSFNATTHTITGTTITPATCTVKITAKDQSGLSASETFQATIIAAAPVIHQTPDQVWAANKAVSLSITSAFADPQAEKLTYVAVLANGKALQAGLTFNATTGTFGGVAPTTLGAMGIMVTAKNQSGLSASETFQSVVAAGAPTAATRAPDQAWTANKAVSLSVASAFADPQAEKLTYTATRADGSALPNWLQLNAATGAFTGTAPVIPQTLALTVTATDQSGLSVSESVHVSVQASAPSLAKQTGALTWMAGKAVSTTLAANTFVDPQGEKLTYTATPADGSALPSGLAFNTSTDAFSGTAPITPETLGLTVTATNASGLSVSEKFSAAIQASAPALAHQTANQSWTDGSSMKFLLPSNTFVDPQGAALTYAAFQTSGADQTGWLHFDLSVDDFTGTVPTGLGGTIGLKIVATGPYGLSSSESFGLTFAASGSHPFAASAPGVTELLALHG